MDALRTVTATALVVLVAACSANDPLVQDTSRQIAKATVNSVVQQRFPGVNAAPVTDCIIDNASGEEILRLAEASVVGSSAQTSQLILDIAARPATANCIANGALSSVLLGGA